MNILTNAFKMSILSAALMLAGGTGQPVFAQDDPLLVTYQGHLTDAAGDPITGNQSLTFTIYDSEGTVLWTEEHPSVPITNGLFNVILGKSLWLLPPSGWDEGRDRYRSGFLGIRVGSDEEMVPRTPLTSVLHAAVSRRLAGDIRTAPGKVVIESSSGDSAIVLAADPGVHAMRLHPPDPCIPPEPCGPAFEVAASAEIHSLKVFPPPPPAGGNPQPQFQVVCGEISETSFCYEDGKLQGPIAGFGVDAESNESYLEMSSTSAEGSGPTARLYTDAYVAGYSFGTGETSDDGGSVLYASVDRDESSMTTSWWEQITSDSSWTSMGSNTSGARAEVHSRKPTGDHTAVAMTTDDALAQLTLTNGDPIGPPDVVVQATTDGGGQIGINTDSPTEALDVNGTTQTTGFKMPTGAADGYVLTSDDDGNGTWQAPSSGGNKAMCADMYEGMTNLSSQVTITFPVTFMAAPHFSVTGLIKSDTYAGKMAHIPKPTPGTSNVTVTVQYWDGVAFDNVGDAVEVMLSYTAIEK